MKQVGYSGIPNKCWGMGYCDPRQRKILSLSVKLALKCLLEQQWMLHRFFLYSLIFFLKIIFFNDVYIHVYWKPNIIVLKCLRQQRLPFWILGYISYTVHRVYIYNKFIECTCTTNLQSVHVQQTVYVQQTCRMYMYNKHSVCVQQTYRVYVYNKPLECTYVQQTFRMYMYNKLIVYVYNKP